MKRFIFTLLCVLPGLAFAEESEEEKSFSADAEFGMLMTSGNTESNATKVKIDAKQDFEHWKNNYILEAFYKEDEVEVVVDDETIDETQTTAEKYFASVQSDYKLDNEHKGIFVYGSYEDDKFSGFEYQATLAIGYSDRLFQTEKSWLDYSIGPGYAIAKTEAVLDEDGIVVEPSEETKTFAARLSGAYQYNISDNAKFTQKISSDVAGDSDKNTKTKSETGLSVSINHTLALKLSYVVQHNSKPPQDKEKKDITTAVTIVFTY